MKKFLASPKSQRFLEILPGAMAWFVIIFPFWASVIAPEFVAYLVIAFMIFWLYRSIISSIFTLRGYFLLKKWQTTNWHAEYKKLKHPEIKWDEVFHLMLVPCAKEPIEVIRRSLTALSLQEVAKEKLIVYLAMEERVKHSHEYAEVLTKEFAHYFLDFQVSYHPDNLVGEVVGKASNERWAILEAKKYLIESGKYDIEKMTAGCCDCDTIVHPKYFSALTYEFIREPHRYLRFWQSVIYEHNNIEEVPGLVRIMSVLGGAFVLSDLQEPRKLVVNYSCYSTSWKLLDDVGYWDPDIIPEDWHIFFKSFFALNGLVEVNPLFLPTRLDAPQDNGYVKTLVNRYEQCKRHAWGVTLMPFIIRQTFIQTHIPLSIRLLRLFKVIEHNVLWSTSWFFVTLTATIIPIMNPVFEQTVLGQNLPRIAGLIMTITLVGLFITLVIDAKVRPPHIAHKNKLKRFISYTEWFFMPIATLFMASLPGLDAQTRLMLGKYMEYKVTEKI